MRIASPHWMSSIILAVSACMVLQLPGSCAFQATHNAGFHPMTTLPTGRRVSSFPGTESRSTFHRTDQSSQIQLPDRLFSSPESTESPRNGILFPLRRLISNSFQRLIQFRRKLATFAVAMALVFSVSLSALAGPSGYSAGGSFRSRSPSYGRPPIQRYAPSSAQRRSYSTPYPRVTHKPHFHHHTRSRNSSMHGSTALAARVISPADYAVLGTTGGLIIYGVAKNQRSYGQDRSNRFGLTESGATAASLTVALNIPDRQDPHNILGKLKTLMNQADTASMEGVQFLVAEAALELLRNERSITACYAESQHYRDPQKAERTFQSTSVNTRSQVDFETVRRFGGQEMGQGSEKSSASSEDSVSKATRGIVTINVAMDGDLPLMVKGRADLIDALRHISSYARSSHDLFCGEVLLAPGDVNEILTEQDLIIMQPKLTTM